MMDDKEDEVARCKADLCEIISDLIDLGWSKEDAIIFIYTLTTKSK